MSFGLVINPVQPRNWRPGWAPQSVGLRGGWRPLPLPAGPVDIERTLAQSVIPGLDYEPELGQASPRAIATGAILVPTLIAGVMSYVGFRLGMKDEGVPAFLGNMVGALSGIAALFGLLAAVGIATVPMPAAAAPAPARPAQEVAAPGPIITTY